MAPETLHHHIADQQALHLNEFFPFVGLHLTSILAARAKI
jgi:hypothetical protein